MRNETITQKFFELKRWDTDEVIHSGKFRDIKELVEDAIRRGISLLCADFRGAYLRGANFRGADLRGANFRGADLRYADLQYADFQGADLRDADFRGADLRDANLQGADLWGADLPDTDFVTACPWGNAHIQHDNIRIGCEYHTTEEWRNFTNDEIGWMDEGALEWWERWKTVILAIADACENYEVKE